QNPLIQQKIKNFEAKIVNDLCSDIPTAFWHRKKHIVTLPYVKDFNERNIPTKARPIQMNHEVMEFCKKEIEDLLHKGIIRHSKSPWSCAAFYVQKNAELERGTPRLVINYKPLNTVLEWIRYPIPNKRDLINRLDKSVIFSKFDMKSVFWQIQIHEDDKYKTAFVTPFGHYEWNVMPFGLKNAPSEFQNIMNDIFNPYSHFSIVYIDDVLIYSQSIEQHWKHLNQFFHIIKTNGLVVSASKIKLFQTKIRFLGFNIHQLQITPIDRVIHFADKFPYVILDKNQLQRFLGSLNYIADFYQNLRQRCKPLFDRLQKSPPPWTSVHTSLVKEIKTHVKTLPCLGIPLADSFKIVETDASDIGYGGILKQQLSPKSPEQIVRFHSGTWTQSQCNYSTIKKEILSIVLCITKFQDDLLNQKFLVRVDCKSAKHVLEKDVQNIASKQIFARWQAILSIFDFEIAFIKGSDNHIPDFLTREFLQGSKQQDVPTLPAKVDDGETAPAQN
ncbi:MAG TPA: reverse transcriptase family protein, partial [Nitrosopumilaceae archaeon]|nr:reverse transcriptase family protein [Nitrosopumilaceae archaeon]